MVVNPEKSVNASLPETTGFFSIDQENVIVTTIKKAEEGEGIVVRLYDSEGQAATVRLESFFKLDKLQHTNLCYP